MSILPPSMQAMEIRNGALVACKLPLPQPAEHEVLIRVSHSGVNRADAMQIAGKYDPPEGASPLPGLEVSGWIALDGEGFNAGQEVCALLAGGGYAEYVAAPAAQTLRLPQGLSLKHAASLPEAAATSLMALLSEGHLKSGERVLIHGGASGVGILMTQIARSFGAQVYATVGSAKKKAAFLQAHGITPINHTTAPFAEQVMSLTNKEGVDLIIDTLGGPQLNTHLRLLKPGGRLVTLAMLEGSEVGDFKMTRLLMHHLKWSGTTLRSKTAAEKAQLCGLVQEHVWPAIAMHAVKPVIDSVFPLSEAKKALARMQERLHMGKILLEVAP